MATASYKSTVDPEFRLSARQEQLLFAALNSNNPSSIDGFMSSSTDALAMPPSAFTESPTQAPGSGSLGFEESPYIDYDNEFDVDGGFDYDFSNDTQGQMIGKIPGTSSDGDAENDRHDKRNHDEVDDNEEGGGKRREGDEKTAKKPGRKPLTSEPTTKRKAQNRAAQRAFRERKEKHLKDLETKVDDLQKASESANHENSILRSQIEKMSAELRDYKKRLSLNGGLNRSPSSGSGVPTSVTGKGYGGAAVDNPNDVNFQFEFPRFGRLPGPPPTTNGSRSSVSSSATQQVPSPIENASISPRNQSLQHSSTNGPNTAVTQSAGQVDGGDMSSLSGLFSPSLLQSISKSPSLDFSTNNGANRSNSSTDSNNGQMNGSTNYSSPSASSNSNLGASSSCGTSPEPSSMQSPVNSKPADPTLTTIGEEIAGDNTTSGFLGNTNFDVNGIDWFAQQNGNQFDPQLFGDYRESQDSILSNDLFNNDSFFSEAFAMPDFSSPIEVSTSQPLPKKDLVQQIDEKQNEDAEVVAGQENGKTLNCNTIWDRLQKCPKVVDGEFDLDLLCKDLQKKAKCSETGAIVNESDFNKVVDSYVNKGSLTSPRANNA